MTSLNATVHETGDGVVVALAGELDYAATDSLEAELEKVEQAAPERLVLDLREVTFIDSSGLRLLLAADARAQDRGRRLELVRGPDVVQRVFEISLLDRRLTFVDDPAERR